MLSQVWDCVGRKNTSQSARDKGSRAPERIKRARSPDAIVQPSPIVWFDNVHPRLMPGLDEWRVHPNAYKTVVLLEKSVKAVYLVRFKFQRDHAPYGAAPSKGPPWRTTTSFV